MDTVTSHKSFAEAAELHARAVAELERLRAEHTELALALAATGPTGAPAQGTAEERTRLLLAGELPPTPGQHLTERQAQEQELREKIARLSPLVPVLASRVEVERERARREALEADPDTARVREAWTRATAAVEAALSAATAQRQRLLAAGFGADPILLPPRLREVLWSL